MVTITTPAMELDMSLNPKKKSLITLKGKYKGFNSTK